MKNRLLVELVLHENVSVHNPDDSSVSSDVVFSPSCHPLKFILIVTIPLVPQILTTLKTCAHLSFSCLVQSACFLWKHNVFWNRLQNQFNTRILNLEHTVNVTAVFTCLESNDNDPVNGATTCLRSTCSGRLIPSML